MTHVRPPDAPREPARARLLAAAARVYAQHGFVGATTRLIAEAADVNEVTIFRLFGSKDALVDAAVRAESSRQLPAALPSVPCDPERELAAWCDGELTRLRRSAELLRHCFAEVGEHPAHARGAITAIADATRTLREYVERLVARELAATPENASAAIAMLVSALVADALVRDQVADVYPESVAEASLAYTRAFLASLGVLGCLGCHG